MQQPQGIMPEAGTFQDQKVQSQEPKFNLWLVLSKCSLSDRKGSRIPENFVQCQRLLFLSALDILVKFLQILLYAFYLAIASRTKLFVYPK